MLATPCTPCPSTALNTQVPGPDGVPGEDGTAGVSAFTTLTAPLTIPAVGSNVTAAVGNTTWVSYGQFLTIGDTATGSGPATFQVVGIPTATSLTLKFEGYPSDLAVGTILPTGSKVTVSGEWGLPTPLTVYAAGTGYSLDATPQLLNFGTTDPSLVITAPGTYLLFARVRVDYAAATFVAVRTVSLLLRRTNNTAANITNAVAGFKTPLSASALTYTAGMFELAPVVYVTSNSTDIIQAWGSIDVAPGAGTIDAVEASIVAVRIS